MTIKRVFKNTMIGSQMILKNGKAVQFTNGRYETADEAEIAELENEIKANTPHLYIDPEDSTIDTGEQDFIREAQVKATLQARKDYEAMKNGDVVDRSLVKDKEGEVHRLGASEEQQAKLGLTVTTTNAEGTADGAKQATPQNANLAKLLTQHSLSTSTSSVSTSVSTVVAPKSTGIAGTGNGAS